MWIAPDKAPSRKGPVMSQPPVGTEVLDTYGYVKVKLAADVWRYKHKIVWEQHYGRKPRGVIKFLDSNRANCNIDNLVEVSRADVMRRNSLSHLPEELQQVIRTKGSLTRLINARRKKDEQHADTEKEHI